MKKLITIRDRNINSEDYNAILKHGYFESWLDCISTLFMPIFLFIMALFYKDSIFYIWG